MESGERRVVETELCAYSVEACRIAREQGVLRAELCAAPAEGGVTPSAAAIVSAREIEGLRLHVMIRPRGGDFLYSDEEFSQMKRDIGFARECGADGVVVGILTADGEVDVRRTAELVREARGMDVTFHRAFDMTRDLPRALEDVIATGCTRILTSGGCNTAAEGLGMLERLSELAGGRIKIMAGSGVNPRNAACIAAAGVDAIHFSARSVRRSGMVWRKAGISMGGCSDVPEYDRSEADAEIVAQIMAALRQRE